MPNDALEIVAAVVDEGLCCVKCGYNLTGAVSERCSECGWLIDWEVARHQRDRHADGPGTAWERWPWRWKPLGFVLTLLEAVFLPWRLAQSLSLRPRLRWPLAFLSAYLVAVWIMANRPSGGGHGVYYAWMIGVLSCIVIQTMVMGMLVPPHTVRFGWRFWASVCCYLSYPIIVEAALDAPAALGYRWSSIWPFSLGNEGFEPDTSVSTTILFYWWWLSLILIGLVRSRRRGWLFWAAAIVPLLAGCVSTYIAVYASSYL